MNESAPVVQFLNSLFGMESGWVILKWVYVMLFGMYLVFALVVAAQVRQMTAALNGSMDKFIKLLGIALVVLAAGALVLAIVIL